MVSRDDEAEPPHISCKVSAGDHKQLSDESSEVFPYWSFTKTVIAICALKLAERGLIDLNAPLSGHGFTLRQLLNHTSGLSEYVSLPDYHRAVVDRAEPWPCKQLISAAMRQGMVFAPGMGWSYSNIGYMLARDVVEDVLGSPFSELFRHLIGDELELESVRLATTREEFAPVLWDAAKTYDLRWVGHGCLIGTAADAAWLLHGLFSGRLLRAETREQILARYPLGGAIGGRPWTECGYGLGLMSGAFSTIGRAIGHSGGGPFCVNAVYHFPDLASWPPLPALRRGLTKGWPSLQRSDAQWANDRKVPHSRRQCHDQAST